MRSRNTPVCAALTAISINAMALLVPMAAEAAKKHPKTVHHAANAASHVTKDPTIRLTVASLLGAALVVGAIVLVGVLAHFLNDAGARWAVGLAALAVAAVAEWVIYKNHHYGLEPIGGVLLIITGSVAVAWLAWRRSGDVALRSVLVPLATGSLIGGTLLLSLTNVQFAWS